MPDLSSVPDEVGLKAYGGDTFTFSITAPEQLVDGREWSGQVRATKDAGAVDAAFTITPPATPGGPAYLTLPASVTAAMVGSAPVRRINTPIGLALIAEYKGFYDVQVSGTGGVDPVTTLVRGSFSVTLDVTRDA